jgi:hypothetical protein
LASLVFAICLISAVNAANPYRDNDDWRSLPFIEMMAAMIKAMNDIMGSDNDYYPGLYSLPYSPAFMPGSGFGMPGSGFGNNPMNSFSSLPMSPGYTPISSFNSPMNSFNSLYSRQSGENWWQPNKATKFNSTNKLLKANQKQSLNGIWQAFSGDIIAIYKDNYFIWSDGNERNLAGRLVIKGNKLYAYIPAKNTTLEFQFYSEPGQFIVRDKTSRIYTFKRLH